MSEWQVAWTGPEGGRHVDAYAEAGDAFQRAVDVVNSYGLRARPKITWPEDWLQKGVTLSLTLCAETIMTEEESAP